LPDGVDVVPNARVFVEAYYRTSFMRFDCGSVASFAPPADRRLTEIDGTNVLRFRVKVVDDHRIVAVADDIVVSAEKPEASGRMPLLPVNFSEDLGQQAWQVVFESSGPVLALNSRIDGIRDIAATPRFRARLSRGRARDPHPHPPYRRAGRARTGRRMVAPLAALGGAVHPGAAGRRR
jgi:hypothetical protein